MTRSGELLPVRSVCVLPRWLYLSGLALSWGCILGCLGLVVWGAVAFEGGGRGGMIGGGIGGMIGGFGALFGVWNDHRRRLDPAALLRCLQQVVPSRFVRVAVPISLAITVLALLLGACGVTPQIWLRMLHAPALILFLAGTQEAIRRHLLHRARAVFMLYADGVLVAEDARAIDDARARHPDLDRAVRDFQTVAARLQARDGAG